jgi:hypothetical protein
MGQPASMSTKIGLGMFAIIIAIAVSTCGESDIDKKKKAEVFDALPFDQQVKSLSSNITAVDSVVKGDTLMITFFKPSIWNGKNWTWNFLETALKVLSRIGDLSHGEPYKRVTFMAQIPTRNNLGQESQQLAMKVTYNMGKMSGAKWDKMTSFDIAELADEIEFRRLGTEAVIEYCKDDDHIKYTPLFCKRALISAMNP